MYSNLNSNIEIHKLTVKMTIFYLTLYLNSNIEIHKYYIIDTNFRVNGYLNSNIEIHKFFFKNILYYFLVI